MAQSKERTCSVCKTTYTGRGLECSKGCREEADKSRPFKTYVCSLEDCGKSFQAVRKSKFCSNEHRKKCFSCGEEFVYSTRNLSVLECRSCLAKQWTRKTRKTLLEKYGVENPSQIQDVQEKKKKNNLEKYGVEHAILAPEVVKKRKKTMLERHGAETPFESKEIREKAKITHKNRYGVENPFESKETKKRIRDILEDKYGGVSYGSPVIAKKARETLVERYGVDNPWKSKEIREKAENTSLEKHGYKYPFEDRDLRDKSYAVFLKNLEDGVQYDSPRISKVNKRIAEAIEKEFGFNVTFEKSIDGYSYDLFVNNSVLLEINPTISHNSYRSFICLKNKCSTPCSKHEPTKPTYHQDKSILAMNNDYSLFQFFDWNTEEELLSFLRGKFSVAKKISARKLLVKKISQAEANRFLNTYHIQGHTKNQTYCYALLERDILVAVATFGKPRFNKKYEHEWIRYAVKSGYIIHGASGRFFKEFVKDTNSKSVVSYVDFNHTTAPQIFLNTVGFEEIKPTGPQLIWSKGVEKIYNNSLVRQGADRLLGTNYGRPEECGLNNEQIMILEGWLPVYTAGNRVFVWSDSKV